MYRDNHHLLFSRQEWSLRPEAKALRENKSLIVNATRAEHEELHRNCPAVPLLGYSALVRVLCDYEPGNNQLESIENLMRSIDKAGSHPKAHPVEKKLSELTVWALDLQRPFIAGIVRGYER